MSISLTASRLLLILPFASLLYACSNDGHYYEVTRVPPDGCVTFEDIRSRSQTRLCGLKAGKRYQVDAFYTVGNAKGQVPLDQKIVELTALNNHYLDYIPARALMPYGRFLDVPPEMSLMSRMVFTFLIHIGGCWALLFLPAARMPLAVVSQPFAFGLWGLLVYASTTSVNQSLMGSPEEFAGILWFSLVATVVALSYLPWTAKKYLGVGATEAFLEAYFSLRGANALEVRRQQHMHEQERRKMDEQARLLDQEEAQLKAKMQAAGASPQEFLEMFETYPDDVGQIHTYIEEVKRRWVEKQLKKSVDVTTDRVKATAELYAAYAEVQRKKTEMVRASEEFKRVGQIVAGDQLAETIRLEELQTRREELKTKRAALAAEQARSEAERKAFAGTTPGALPAGLGVTIGRTEDAAGNPKTISLNPSLREQHYYILGKTQTGKTTLIMNLIRQDMEQGNGCAFIDPHGDAALKLLAYVPERRIEDVVYLDFTETSPVVAFNLLAAPADQRAGLVDDFLSYFNRFFGTDPTTAPRMLDILRYSLLTLLHSHSPKTIADLRYLLMDGRFREEVLRDITDPDLITFWKQRFPNFPKGATEPILTRLSAFLAPGSPLRPILTQVENLVDFKQILNEGKILIARLSKGRGLEEATHFLGALLITRIQQEALARTEIPMDRRRPFYLYVDEFQNYTVNSFETILAEAAKYRLSVTMANQNLHQLPASLRSAILGNVGTFTTFRIGSEDAPVIQREMRKPVERPGRTPTGNPTTEKGWFPEVEDLQNLRPYEAYVRLGRPDLVERIKTFPLLPPPPNSDDISREVRAWSRRRYYRGPKREERPRDPQQGSPRGSKDFLE